MVANPLRAQLQDKKPCCAGYSSTIPRDLPRRRRAEGGDRRLAAGAGAHPTVPAGQANPSRQPSVQDAMSLGQLQQLELQVGA